MSPSPDQYETLIGKIDELSDELKAHKPILVKSNRRANAATVVGIVGVVGVAVGAVAIFSNANRLDDAEASRTSARVVACVQANLYTDKVRTALVAGLLTFIPDPEHPTPQQQQAIDGYTNAVELILDYRDCSPEGIAAYYANLPPDPADEG